MITINYIGQFGNRMFQYSFARLLAEHNKINLATPFGFDNIVQTTPHKQYTEPSVKKSQIILIGDKGYDNFRQKNGSKVIDLDPNYNYVVEGYFQDAELFNNYEDVVRTFFVVPEVKKNYDDTLVLFRLGDFAHEGYNSEIIDFNWYNKAIEQMPGKKVFVVSSNKSTTINCTKEHELNYLKKINMFESNFIEPLGLKEDFEYIYGYDNIISSNSTWSWWACFLSKSSNIITMDKFGWIGIEYNLRSHGVHINNLKNIRNISKVIPGVFIDITKI